MSGVSGVGGSGNIPQEPLKQPETSQNELDAINSFNNLIQDLASLTSEAKLGGKSYG